jgi:Flp pilus assembly protein TadD
MAAVQADLEDIDIAGVWDLLSLFIADREGLDRYCGDVPVVTDDHPLIEHFLSLPWNASIVAAEAPGEGTESFLEEFLLHRTSLLEHLEDVLPDNHEQAYVSHRLAMERFLEGVIYTDRGLDGKGIDEIRRASRLLPENGYFKHYLGASEHQRKQLEDILVRGAGDARQVLSRYGSLELENGNSGRAVEVFTKYVSLFTDDPAGFLYRGMALERTGDFPEAREAYVKAGTLAPDAREAVGQRVAVIDAKVRNRQEGSMESLSALAALLWESERYGEASETYAELVRRDPRDELARYNLAACLDAEGDVRGALEQYEAAFQLDPEVQETGNNIDKLRLLLALTAERSRKVALLAGTEVETSYESPRARALLGSCYARNDEYGRAAREYLKALALDPGYEEARAMLATVEKLGREEGTR